MLIFASLMLQILRQTHKPQLQKHQTQRNLSQRLVKTLPGTGLRANPASTFSKDFLKIELSKKRALARHIITKSN